MFTGLIDHCGKILQIDSTAYGKRLVIACAYSDLSVGESIAIDGVCLTVTDYSQGEFQCDISPETLKVTTANELTIGRLVNLERCLRANDRLHGHFVLGHVDQTCTLAAKNLLGDYMEYRFSGVLEPTKLFLVTKGSVAINGVSLTLNTIDYPTHSFAVMLIPETLKKTNLAALEVGDAVNIEYDYLAKLVNNPLQKS